MDKEIRCFECGAKNSYELKEIIRNYSGDGYSFEMLVKIPFCKECKTPIFSEEIESDIVQKANREIRKQRDIVTKEEIIEILDKYNVSQKTLSRFLGWGEITLTRYITGNYSPNKQNSDKIKELKNPYMFQKIIEDRSEEKKSNKAQIKVYEELQKIEKENGKIFSVVNWFLSQSSEDAPLTHLALQKLLYFAQGWSMTLLGKELFKEECQAWAHGAVYPKVYDLFRQFKYMPLPRLEEKINFEKDELAILNAVKKYYYDVFNARALENICHCEDPYKESRAGYGEGETCQNIIDKESIRKYYNKISRDYNINLEGLSKIKDYLNTLLK